MLKITIKEIREKVVAFTCPTCEVMDVMYIRMPKTCWNCDSEYHFDITELISKETQRCFFHFNGMTSA